MQDIEIKKLENYGDKRGALYNISDTEMQFLDKIKNTLFGRISPGSIRGNHYHRETREILIIMNFSSVFLYNIRAQIHSQSLVYPFIISTYCFISINLPVMVFDISP
jgi:dTDP-4-dehydrorhamnose 3,5-epimerase-like enzyme